MTRCIVLGEDTDLLGKTPIEFKKCIAEDGRLITPVSPNDYKNIELVKPASGGQLDVMFAYNKNRKDGYLYLGHWNDGFVK